MSGIQSGDLPICLSGEAGRRYKLWEFVGGEFYAEGVLSEKDR